MLEAAPDGSTTDVLVFEDFRVDLARAQCTRAGAPVALRPKSFALLHYLASHAGRALSKAELLANVWPGLVVGDDSLSQCINELRGALGARGPALIVTVPKRGYRFDAEVRAGAPAAAVAPLPAAVQRPRGLRWPALAGALLLSLLALAAGTAAWRTPPMPIDAALAERRSVGVMPFADLGAEPAAHVAEGITQEILTDLGRLPDTLVVAGGTPEPGERATDARRLGALLGVRHLLTGSVRRDGERIAVNVQMARTSDGGLIWSERFDYDNPQSWNWVRDVSQRVAGTLEVRLTDLALDPAHEDVRSSRAMDEWMRGAYMLHRVRTRAELLEARRHLEDAVAAEPRSVNALAQLSGSYLQDLLLRWSPSRERSLASAREYAARAMAIDPNHMAALLAMNDAHQFAGDFGAALPLLQRALVINPNSALAHRDMTMYLYFTLQFDQVAREADMALRLAPMDRDMAYKVLALRGAAELLLGQDEQAYRTLHAAVRADSRYPGGRQSLIAAAALTGRIDEAHRLVAELMRDRPELTIAGLRSRSIAPGPVYAAAAERIERGLRLAGLPEGEPTVAAAPDQNRK